MSIWILTPLTPSEKKTQYEEMEKERKMLAEEGVIPAEKKKQYSGR